MTQPKSFNSILGQHHHTGSDSNKVLPTDLQAWSFSPKTPAQTVQIPNGQWSAFQPVDIGIYTSVLGWNVISFVNAYVQKTDAGSTVSPLATYQLFTGTAIADNHGEMTSGTFTAAVAGWYQVNFTAAVDLNGTMVMKKNGTAYAHTTGTGSLSISRMVQLAQGNTLTFFITNNDSVSSMTVSGTLLDTELDIYKISNVN